MGTLSGIAFTSITPFTPITPEGGGWGEGSNGVELVCFSSPSEQADCLRCFALSLFFGGQRIKPETGVRRATTVCNI